MTKSADIRDENRQSWSAASLDPNLSSHEPSEVRRWIGAICKIVDIKPTRFAKEASVVPSTVNRFYYNTVNAPKNLGGTTIYKLEGAAKHLLGGGQEPKVAKGNRGRKRSGKKTSRRYMEVIGHVLADDWRGTMYWPDEQRYVLPAFFDSAYDGYPIFGLEVAGEDMNEVYPPGSLLTCIPFSEIDRGLKPGEHVVVERENGKGKVEISAKEYFVDGNGKKWLRPESSYPEYQPVAVGTDTQIIALVVASIRDEGVKLPPKKS